MLQHQETLFCKKDTKTIISVKSKKITFIDLFAGIGGFHCAMSSLNAKCNFVCEIDSNAKKTYLANFKIDENIFVTDITKIASEDVPSHDILCAGFPCQPFSQAGFKKGFEDTRGTLFFDIARIIKAKQPKAFFLENVAHLLKHDNGSTFKVIKQTLLDLGYTFYYKIIKASDFGLPQNRARLFMVGFKNDKLQNFEFPKPIPLKLTMSDILGGNCDKKIGYTLRVGGRGSKITDRRNWDSYKVDDKIVQIGVNEAKKMQGLPDDFIFPVSPTQTMKQLGNSVAIPVIKAIGDKILNYIQINESE